MPRELTDLMERATSFAPPEPHVASDITRRAAQAQRRRTTGIAASLAVVVVVAGAIGYGTTRNNDEAPKPVGPPHDSLHQSVTDAVPASSVPGFSTLDYGVPSVAHDLGPLAPNGFGQYADVDAAGRLMVMKVTKAPGSQTELAATYELVVAGGAQDVVPGPGSPSDLWQPSFVDGGGLGWQGNNKQTLDYVLTDAQGQHRVVVTNDLSGVSGQTPDGTHPVRSIWYEDGRVWFSAVTRANGATAARPRQQVSLFSVDPAHPSVLRAEKPTNALEIAVGGGVAVWLDGSTVRAVDLSTGAERTVPVPMDPGCALPVPSYFFTGSSLGALTTNGHLVSLHEVCSSSNHLVVTDLDGRLVTDITSTSPGYLQQVRMSGDLLTFEGDLSDGSIASYVADLARGQLVRLGASRQQPVAAPRANGRYVLWYDADGGHVARLGS